MNTITPEMLEFFEKRTKEHIDRVQNNMALLANYKGYSITALRLRGQQHDLSKYSQELIEPYVWISWWYKCRNEGHPIDYPTKEIEKAAKGASNKHTGLEKHHPEAHKDISDMSELDLIEMTCDWSAMAEELNQDGGSAIGWANKVVGSKFKFNPTQTQFIYDTIAELDRRKGLL